MVRPKLRGTADNRSTALMPLEHRRLPIAGKVIALLDTLTGEQRAHTIGMLLRVYAGDIETAGVGRSAPQDQNC